ncbi:MAG TPA: hypothetical protein V6D27_13610 [Vampirovibrionales bacterium]
MPSAQLVVPPCAGVQKLSFFHPVGTIGNSDRKNPVPESFCGGSETGFL